MTRLMAFQSHRIVYNFMFATLRHRVVVSANVYLTVQLPIPSEAKGDRNGNVICVARSSTKRNMTS